MKRTLIIILSAAMILVSASCSSSLKNEGKKEDPGNTAEVQETREDSDDFQAGIPPEYRLKRNITTDLDEPLPPAPEGAPEASFFSLMEQGGSNVDIGTIVNAEELESYFGMKINKDESSSIKSSPSNATLQFKFIPKEGEDAPELGVTLMSYATEAEAEEGYEMWGGEEIQGGPGKKSRKMNMFDLTMITVLTENNEVISISASMFENQEELLLEYTRELVRRFAELSNR